MPVVGVEPTRVISTRDFEFLSASSIWCHPVISSDIWFPLCKGKIHASTNNNLKYEAEQKELKERAAAIRAELSKAQEATVNAEKFMNVVRKYTSFEELTPTLLREFVEKIVVHECSYDENGTRRQDIDIYYSFVGKVDLPE